jgi:hypothetical protein
MLRSRLLRRTACVALALFAFAQGASAAMGCAALRVAEGVAVMPSGEPCDMVPAQPGAIAVEHFSPDELVTGDAGPSLPDAGGGTILVLPDRASAAEPRPRRAAVAQRILGPPPLLATRRWRI